MASTTYRLGGQIVAVQTKVGAAAGVFYFTYTDHLGNISAMSTIAGVYVADSRAWYDPFGTFISDPTANPPDANPVPSSNPSISNHGFTGHRHNNTGTNNLGLIYMNARYYLPEIGRFVSPDTIVPDPSNPQSYNRYSYGYNNPVKYVDPSGHCAGNPDDVNNPDIDCWVALDGYQSQFPNLTFNTSLSYDELKLYLGRYQEIAQRNWIAEALLILLNAGSTSRHAAEFIISNGVGISIKEFRGWQQGMGVRYSRSGDIEMRSDTVSWTDPVRKEQLPGLVHEGKHLEQGLPIALSQLGEVQGWYVQAKAAEELNVNIGFIPSEVTTWGTDPTESNFQKAAQAIINGQGRDYLFWLLPRMNALGYRSYSSNLNELP